MKKLFILATIVLASNAFAESGTIIANQTLDPVINVTIKGQAAVVLYNNLADHGEMNPGSIVKKGADITCASTMMTMGKTKVECYLSVDQHGRISGNHIR